MAQQKEILHQLLLAKEERAELRGRNMPTLSLSLNIPGYPKSNKNTQTAFGYILDDLLTFLTANRIDIEPANQLNTTDAAGHFFLASIHCAAENLPQLKQLAEQFETKHSIGRLVDVDVFDASQKAVSSHKLKSCFLCADKTAIDCMRSERHSYEQLQSHVQQMLNKYITQQNQKYVCRKLVDCATKAMLYEVSLSPKPGLVDFNSAGSHTDMHYYTFLNSTAALAPFWLEFVEAGIQFDQPMEQGLPIIRQIGLRAEKAMYEATAGVNTQKGLIFLLGISIFLSAKLLIKKQFDQNEFVEIIKQCCNQLIEKELDKSNELNQTHGEQTYAKYGIAGAGIRYQAQYGFPIVFEQLLPHLEKKLNTINQPTKAQIDAILGQTLLLSIAELNDSNILYRKGLEKATKLKELAKNAFDNQSEYHLLEDFCQQENISPGGSADMLALTLFFHFIKSETNLNNEF